MALHTAGLAQTDFRPGYVLPLTGDTLRGELDYRGSLRSSRLCRFRPAAGAPATEYRPEQLRGYGFAGSKHYEARAVALAAGPDSTRLFLERLVSGKAALYFVRDDQGQDHFYVAKAGGPLRALRQTSGETTVDGLRYQQTNREYQGVLADVFVDCVTVKAGVSKVRLNAGDLTAAVRGYNACNVVQPLPLLGNNTRTRISVVLGVAQSTLGFATGNLLSEQDFRSQPAPVLGLGFYFPLANLSEKLGLAVDLLYTREKYQERTFRSKQAGYGSEQQAKFNDAYLLLPVQLRYSLPQFKPEPFLQLGGSVGYALQLGGEYRYRAQLPPYDYNAWTPIYTTDGQARSAGLFSRRQLAFGAVASIGLGKLTVAGRPFAVELRAERTNGVTDATLYSSSFTRFSALLHVGLRK
ncbi:PorT family protein [Hymenobacter sp. 15J16-1T3B]|nr:PorT family protein [Hymenobacter sp. 15J16-1T3B]